MSQPNQLDYWALMTCFRKFKLLKHLIKFKSSSDTKGVLWVSTGTPNMPSSNDTAWAASDVAHLKTSMDLFAQRHARHAGENAGIVRNEAVKPFDAACVWVVGRTQHSRIMFTTNRNKRTIEQKPQLDVFLFLHFIWHFPIKAPRWALCSRGRPHLKSCQWEIQEGTTWVSNAKKNIRTPVQNLQQVTTVLQCHFRLETFCESLNLQSNTKHTKKNFACQA